MQTENNETFLFCCKRFSTVSNEKVYNFLSYLIFFFTSYAWLLLFFVLTVMKTGLASCDTKIDPWLGNCLLWFTDQNIWKVEKLWTGYLTTNSKIKYITHFSWKNHTIVQRTQRYVESIANNATVACIVRCWGPLFFFQTNSMFAAVLAKN